MRENWATSDSIYLVQCMKDAEKKHDAGTEEFLAHVCELYLKGKIFSTRNGDEIRLEIERLESLHIQNRLSGKTLRAMNSYADSQHHVDESDDTGKRGLEDSNIFSDTEATVETTIENTSKRLKWIKNIAKQINQLRSELQEIGNIHSTSFKSTEIDFIAPLNKYEQNEEDHCDLETKILHLMKEQETLSLTCDSWLHQLEEFRRLPFEMTTTMNENE